MARVAFLVNLMSLRLHVALCSLTLLDFCVLSAHLAWLWSALSSFHRPCFALLAVVSLLFHLSHLFHTRRGSLRPCISLQVSCAPWVASPLLASSVHPVQFTLSQPPGFASLSSNLCVGGSLGGVWRTPSKGLISGALPMPWLVELCPPCLAVSWLLGP